METKTDRKQKNPSPRSYRLNVLGWGTLLIAVGLVILGRNLGMIDNGLFRIIISWQSLLIVLGIWSLFTRHPIGGVVLIGVGAFFLIPKISDVGAGWVATYWPLIFILLGIIVLIRLMRPAKRSGHHYDFTDKTVSDTRDGFVDSSNSFSGVRHIVLDPVFRGASIRNSFGGTVLDLRRTTLEGPETVIDVDVSVGGLEIYLPGSWIVVDKISPFMGAVEDKRYAPVPDPENTQRLILTGKVTLGGVELKS